MDKTRFTGQGDVMAKRDRSAEREAQNVRRRSSAPYERITRHDTTERPYLPPRLDEQPRIKACAERLAMRARVQIDTKHFYPFLLGGVDP